MVDSYSYSVNFPQTQLIGEPAKQALGEKCGGLLILGARGQYRLDPDSRVCNKCKPSEELESRQVHGTEIVLPKVIGKEGLLREDIEPGFEPDWINLIRDLVERKDKVLKNLIWQLLTYGTGREPQLVDHVEIRKIEEQVKRRGYGMRDLVTLVAASKSFRRR